MTGTDLLPAFAEAAPVDLFGMGADRLRRPLRAPAVAVLGHRGPAPGTSCTREMARRRVYLHPVRWTSLGLSLLEAMHLGMPVVALATTEVPDAVPAPPAGRHPTSSTCCAGRAPASPPTPRRRAPPGKAARAAALERYGLDRFLADWDAPARR